VTQFFFFLFLILLSFFLTFLSFHTPSFEFRVLFHLTSIYIICICSFNCTIYTIYLYIYTVYHRINARALINFKHLLSRRFFGTSRYLKEAIIKSSARCNVIVKR
jgi:hypothetical protein